MFVLFMSILCGIYRRFVFLFDAFRLCSSHKMNWRFLFTSILYGIYHRFMLLFDVEVRFDCVGSYGDICSRAFCMVFTVDSCFCLISKCVSIA